MSEYIFLDCSLYLPAHKTLILSDLHLGQEEAILHKGVMIPKTQCDDIVQRLATIRKKVPVDRIVFNGDIKHEFGFTLNTEWREITRIVDSLVGIDVVFVGGNHDMILAPIAQKLGIPLVRRYQIGSYLCIHGDKKEKNIPAEVRTLIMGHEHPCISFRSGLRMEKFKCFLEGKYEEFSLIVLPSFTSLTLGVDVLETTKFSSYLAKREKFLVYVQDGDITRCFGTIEQLRYIKNTI